MGRGRTRSGRPGGGAFVVLGTPGNGMPEQQVLGERGSRVRLGLPGGGEELVTMASLRRNYNPSRVGGESIPASLYRAPGRDPVRTYRLPDGRTVSGQRTTGRNGATVKWVENGRFVRETFPSGTVRAVRAPRTRSR